MLFERRIVHILDDLDMGGVTRALKNFEHPKLQRLGVHTIADIRNGQVRAETPADMAVVHFTLNWRKLRWLLDLRIRGRFSRIVLIEHSYTEGFEKSEVHHQARFRRMLKCAYSLVDTVVAVSQAQRRWIVEAGLANHRKTVAIPQSRDCGELFALPPVRRGGGPLKIGAFGRFHRQKGFDLLLEAMARVPADLATLKLAGAGPEASRLGAMAERLPHVKLVAPFSSPNAFLQGVDLVAIPSRWEAFGLVGTEARAAGRPILASRVDGLIDQLGTGAYAHACGNVSSIVRGIYRAASARDLTARGLIARRDAASEHDGMIDGWADLLLSAEGLPARNDTLTTVTSLANPCWR